MSRARKFWALSTGDRLLLAEACLRLIEARVRLLVLSFARAIEGRPYPQSIARRAGEDVRKVQWAIGAATAHLPFQFTCLPRAVAASRMLRALGHDPSLVYGVAAGSPEDGPGHFAAHAWVELAGEPVVGHREAAGYTVLATFPLVMNPLPTSGGVR